MPKSALSVSDYSSGLQTIEELSRFVPTTGLLVSHRTLLAQPLFGRVLAVAALPWRVQKPPISDRLDSRPSERR